MSQPYYLRGSAFNVRMNRTLGWLVRHGLNVLGTTELSVPGRKSGRIQRTPVNLHTWDGGQYLVSARGHSQWVRNLAAAGAGELRVGRKVRTFTADVVPDSEKLPILRSYLERWGWEVNQYFRGVTAKSSDEEIIASAQDHPVFAITITS